jgi:CelD/BcsL family acetyltransferase involved in cellulose biosynthesis
MTGATTTLTAGASRPATMSPVRSGHLRCRIGRDIDVLSHLRPQWDRLAKMTCGGIFMTYDWCRTWWEHYGQRREPRVFLFLDNDELVGVIPMFVDVLRLGPLSLRVARIMGCDHTQGLCDIPVHPHRAQAAFNDLLTRLIVDDRCDAVHFGPITDESRRADMVVDACRRRMDLVTLLRDRAVTQNAVVDLPHSHHAYLASLSRNQRFNIRKEWRRLTDDFDISLDFARDSREARNAFEELIRMHRLQWHQRGNLGHFDDWPGAVEFNRELISAFGKSGRTVLLRMRANGRTIASQCAFLLGDTCHCRFAARDSSPEWDGYGLGRVSLIKLFEHLIGLGIRRVDAGVGHYDYKLRLGATEHTVRSIVAVAGRDGARIRARMFFAASDALDRVYYKTWRYRITRHLPLPQRPLWNAWIRSRL